MADLEKQLGERIKQIRKAAKLTQSMLAESIGLSVEYISRLERGIGQPSFKTLVAMAEVLNVSIKDFFEFKGPILFRDKKQETKQRKEYIDAISAELKDMGVHDLLVVYNVVKGLSVVRGAKI